MVELLAPAGEYKSFIGAINAGADAVYLAGNMYGARASAKNFSTEEIINAVEYAHLFGRKVYLTVNTLTKEEELKGLYDFIHPLYISGLDACIVQDLGVFLYLKECFPDLPIHVSTQSLVTGRDGALFYQKLGASRVVLARELTLDEVIDINKTGIETECFVHGAMCYSYSGACLFSSFLGGNSGNRGRCKGPCRQPYKVSGKEEYVLSLKDMCTVSMIDKLIDAGISSFKIEGRLKSPSYSAGVTSVYRKYIDRYLENPDKEFFIEKNDVELLNSLYSRSGSENGYYSRTSSKSMITINGGAYGKVNEEAEKDICLKYVDNRLSLPVDINFMSISGDYALLSVFCDVGQSDYSVKVLSENIIEKATKIPTSKEDILKHLQKSGNTVFSLANTEIVNDDGFVPASVVNNMRRQALDDLYSEIVSKFKREDKSAEKYSKKSFDFDTYEMKTAFVDNRSQVEIVLKYEFFDSIVLTYDLCFDEKTDTLLENKKINVFYEMPPVLRKYNTQNIIKLIERSEAKKYVTGIYVNQVDQIQLLRSMNFSKEIKGNINLYSYNTYSTDFLTRELDSVCLPTELDINDIKNLGFKNFEITMYGRMPLMQTANCVNKTNGKCSKFTKSQINSYVNIEDRLRVKFPVRLKCYDDLCFNTIYNSKPNSLHKFYDRLKKEGYSNFSFRFTDENVALMNDIIQFYIDLFNHKVYEPKFDFTNGHIKNGVI